MIEKKLGIAAAHLVKAFFLLAPVGLEYLGGIKMGVHRYLLYARTHFPGWMITPPPWWGGLAAVIILLVLSLRLTRLQTRSAGMKTIYSLETGLCLILLAALSGSDFFSALKGFPFFLLGIGGFTVLHIVEMLWLCRR